MKNRFIALTIFVCLWPLLSPRLQAQDAAAYVVADATSGHILLSHRPNKKLQIASLTKIATAMVVLDWLDLSKQDQGALATVPPGVNLISPNNPIGLQPGDQVSVRDLLYAMLIQSDNIAAYTLADHVGRDLQRNTQSAGKPVDLFVAQMNALARKLGMEHTKFLNPTGRDAQETPYSTASDLVKLSAAAMQRSSFRFYVSQKERQITHRLASGSTAQYKLANTNELLGVNAIDGVKTGTSERAGECVVISAARTPESVQNPDGSFTITPRRLIVVVLGSRSRFNDASGLLSEGWNLYDQWAAQGRPLEK
jgi:D-alanyl-D-alanine carboxypeptidase (penicillin-binding protein 5/6)